MVQKRIFLTTADTSPWQVPQDWNPSNNSIQGIGAGSGGNNILGGGGCGGNFSRKINLPISGLIPFVVGVASFGGSGNPGGDTVFNTGNVTNEVLAKGGGAPSGLTGGLPQSGNIGTFTKQGGKGGDAVTNGGGGGGAGGNVNDGGAGSDDGGYGGSNGETPPVNLAEGVPAGANGLPGVAFNGTHGSGGGGGGNNFFGSSNGGLYGGGGGGLGLPGDGGDGLIVITYEALEGRGFFGIL